MSRIARPLIAVPPLAPSPAARIRAVLIVGLGAGGVLCTLGALKDHNAFFGAYLVAFLFALSLAVGALFWVMLHHVTGAAWSVVPRRLLEQLSQTLPWLALLFVPVILGSQSLYGWADVSRQGDAVVASKQAYLNLPFFLVRAALYFGTWTWLAMRLSRWSARQDPDGDATWTRRMRGLSAPGLVLLALTTTFASFDWIASLDPHWYSTIFGVYFWAGAIVGSLAALTALVNTLEQTGPLAGTITAGHRHDLGKLLFSFVVFWAYIAFSQYFLIWYGNIPEETAWYVRRFQGGWRTVALALVIGHFVLPFTLLLGRAGKRNRFVLDLSALLVLGFHYLDLYWQVMPQLQRGRLHAHWLDGACLVTVLAACGLVVVQGMRRQSLIPARDPLLQESLPHEDEFECRPAIRRQADVQRT